MMSEIHLWPSGTVIQEGEAKTGYCLENIDAEYVQIQYRLPEQYASAISASCNPFVLEALFPAMQSNKKLVVHGQVSPSLLKNMDELQSVWHSWKPNKYHRIDIVADQERELELEPAPAKAIMVFSGGVDSCFTAWRHARGLAGRWNQNLKVGMMIHGFDIPLRYPKTFQRAAQRSNIILNSVGMDLVTVVHSTKELGVDTEDNHATILASCLMLFQNQFSTGLIPNSISYYNLLEKGQMPFGSTPLTDPMLSSATFSIIPDGTGHTRFDKIEAISVWPEAMQNLRVCLSREGKIRDLNCGRCEKCVRNILVFRVLGLGLPPCFEKDVSVSRILSLRYGYPVFGTYHDLIGHQSQKRNARGVWITALKYSYWKNRLRVYIQRSLRGMKT